MSGEYDRIVGVFGWAPDPLGSAVQLSRDDQAAEDALVALAGELVRQMAEDRAMELAAARPDELIGLGIATPGPVTAGPGHLGWFGAAGGWHGPQPQRDGSGQFASPVDHDRHLWLHTIRGGAHTGRLISGGAAWAQALTEPIPSRAAELSQSASQQRPARRRRRKLRYTRR